MNMHWTKWLRWALLGAGALSIVILLGVLIAIKTPAFHRYVLATISGKAAEATGGRVEIQNYDFKLSGLTANVFGVVIHGTEADPTHPLFSADRLTIKLKILSVLHQQINLRELALEHPVIRVEVSKNGKTNLPNPAGPKQSSSSVNIFDLAVSHVQIDRGEIYYNDQPHSLDAELRDLQAQVSFSALAKRYDGSLGYHSGRVRYGSLRPMPHTLEAKFSASPGKLSLEPVVTLGASRAQLTAEIRDFDNPYVSGGYDILLHTQDLRDLSTAQAAGDIRLKGKLQYQAQSGRAALAGLLLTGDLSSPLLAVRSGAAQIDLGSLHGRYALKGEQLRAQDFAAKLLGGEIIADLTVANIEDLKQIELHTRLRNISIGEFKTAAAPGAGNIPLAGSINGTADATSRAGLKALQAHADLIISGQVENRRAPLGAVVPVSGAIHAGYDARQNRLLVRNTILHTPATTIQAQGEVSDHSNLNLMVNAGDLREIVNLASTLRPQSPITIPIFGAATLNATVTGSMRAPQISAQLAGNNLQIQNTRWSAARFHVQANPSSLSLQNGMLASADKGQLNFNFTTALRNWSYSADMPMTASATVRDFPAEVLQQLAGVSYPVHGDLLGSINLKGSQQNPAGMANLKLVNANVYGQPFLNLQVQANGDGNSLHATLDAASSAGTLAGTFEFAPRTKAYQVHLRAPQFVLAELVPVKQKDVPVSGKLSAVIDGSGSISNPQLTAVIRIPELQYQQTTLTGVQADLAVANGRGDMTLAAGLANAAISAKASVNLSGDYYASGAFDTTSLPIPQLASIYAPSIPRELQSNAEMHATFKGPLRNFRQGEAHLVIPRLSASYQNLEIENVGPIRADLAASVLLVQPAELRGTGTSVRFHGQVPLQPGRAMSLAAQGNVDMRLLRLFSPDLRTSGSVALDVRGGGSVSQPTMEGTIQLQKVNLATVSAPLGLDQLNGTLTIANNRLQITQLNGQIGGGQISAGGYLAYRPAVQMNLSVNAQSVRLRYPEGVRSIMNCNLTFSGSSESAALEGRVLIDGLSFTQDFDLADFMGQFTGSSVPSGGTSFADRIKMNVAIQTADQLQASSSGLSIEGSANLHLIGTAGDPVIVGRTDLTSGEIFFMKKRYQLERGIINFTDPNRTNPVVNMLITTVVKQYNISLTVVGPLDKLRTSYVSDPPLPPVDIINLIARGQTTEEAAPSSLGANSVLAQGLAGEVSGQLEKLAGLSSLQIDPLLGGDNTNPSARVALQQRVTKNFLFTFSTDLTSAQNEVIQGEYQINKRWSVSVTRDESGGVSVDGKFHTKF